MKPYSIAGSEFPEISKFQKGLIHPKPSRLTPGSDRTGKPPQVNSLLSDGIIKCLILLLTTLLLLGLEAAPSAAYPYPHNYNQDVYCLDCHFTGYGLEEELCLTCHNGVWATLAISHSSANTSSKYGDWGMVCLDCHTNHGEDQYGAWKEEGLVILGISDPDGISEDSLTMSGAGWVENSLVGLVLIPNLATDDYSYKIIGNTTDTITVSGTIDLDLTTTGNTDFGVFYGKLVRGLVTTPNSGQREVRFFGATGVNSFADGDGTYDGICEVCHTQTSHHLNDGSALQQSHNDSTRCTACHTHANGFGGFNHTGAGVVAPADECMTCHGNLGPDLMAGVHGDQCALCHVDPNGGGPLVEPYETTTPHGGTCTDCHGLLAQVHGDFDHTAEPGSGQVVLFADNNHDDAGWTGAKPYFDVTVDCRTCHDSNLQAIHGDDCTTCHPTPYDTLGTWNKGCQQGGCHTTYHQDAIPAHWPFEDAYDEANNDCNICHEATTWAVPQSNCLNCHASYGPGDHSPPVTTSNALASYVGPAQISFSITDNGKVGIGRTFYRLDGDTTAAAGKKLLVTAPGDHALEFWSMDQAGNIESPHKKASFTIAEDTTAPTTTSNARAAYTQGAIIILTATDNGTLGVKETHYRIDDGPIQSGTKVVIPATSGIFTYTLTFWSEDWTGNVEAQKSVSFTVTSGTGTIRLVWGDSDTNPAHVPSGDDSASWTVRRGSWWGPIVASGAGAAPGWDGVDDIIVPVGSAAYFIRIDWYWEGEDDQTDFSNVQVTVPGQIVRLSY